MGGPESDGKYEAFIGAFADYLMRNFRPTHPISAAESDVQEYLDEVLDEEFNTVLDDGSSAELAQLFVRYLHMLAQGKLNDVQQELQVQQAATPAAKLSVRNAGDGDDDDESSSSSESEDDRIDEEERPKPQAMEMDEDGWTTVHRKTGGKK